MCPFWPTVTKPGGSASIDIASGYSFVKFVESAAIFQTDSRGAEISTVFSTVGIEMESSNGKYKNDSVVPTSNPHRWLQQRVSEFALDLPRSNFYGHT